MYVLLRSVAVCVDRLVPVSTSANQICSNFIGCCLSVCVRQKTTLCCVVCCYCSHSRELSNSSLATVCAAAVLLYYAINTYAGFFAKASGGDSLRHPYWCHPPLPLLSSTHLFFGQNYSASHFYKHDCVHGHAFDKISQLSPPPPATDRRVNSRPATPLIE